MGAHVVVVGAGPAGSAAAITLARAGARVTLIDRHSFPRERPCCGLVFPDAQRALAALDVQLNNMGDQLLGLRLLGGRTHAELPLDDPGPRLLVRARVDARLAKSAEAAGARFLQGALVEGINADAEGVDVLVRGDDAVRGDVVISATGPQALFRPRVDPSGRAHAPYAPYALYASARVAPGQFPAAALGFFGERSALPACVTRTRDGTLHATLFVPGDLPEDVAHKRFNELLTSAVGRDVWGDGPSAPAAQRVALPDELPTPADRVLFVGEAAGLVDGLFAGMGGALASGTAAAEALATAIAERAPLDDKTLRVCARAAVRAVARRRRVRTQLTRELESPRAAARLLRAMRRNPGARRAGLRALFADRPSFSLRLELALLSGR